MEIETSARPEQTFMNKFRYFMKTAEGAAVVLIQYIEVNNAAVSRVLPCELADRLADGCS